MPYGYIGYDNSPNTKNGVFTIDDVYQLRKDDNWVTRRIKFDYALVSGGAGGQNSYAGKGGGSGEILTGQESTSTGIDIAIDDPQVITVGAGGGRNGSGGDTIAFGFQADNGTVGTSGNGNGPGGQHHSSGRGGGGGGSGGIGGYNNGISVGGHGGNGTSYSVASVSSQSDAGGGGGGGGNNGGTGGGGNGKNGGGKGGSGGNIGGIDASAGRGSGGGGAGNPNNSSLYSGTGGSGKVMIKYATADADGLNITLGTPTVSGDYTVREITTSGTLTF